MVLVFTCPSNPDTRWDWWVIAAGDGYLFGPKQQEAHLEQEGGFNFGDEHHTPENNRPVAAIPIDDTTMSPLPFLPLKMNGWNRRMGMWANVPMKKDLPSGAG